MRRVLGHGGLRSGRPVREATRASPAEYAIFPPRCNSSPSNDMEIGAANSCGAIATVVARVPVTTVVTGRTIPLTPRPNAEVLAASDNGIGSKLTHRWNAYPLLQLSLHQVWR